MKKLIVEFIGTFFLVFTVGMVVSSTASPVLGALAIGSALMVMVYAGGHISGGHYNPAVTLGVWLRGGNNIATKDVAPYMAAQFVAAIVAAVVVALATQNCPGLVLSGGTGPFVPSVIAEFIGTFALVWVVLNSATAKGTSGNSFYGLAIGFTVFVCAVSVGGISGGAFNPAVGLGVFAMGKANLAMLALYVVINFAGGAAAACTFKFVNGSEQQS